MTALEEWKNDFKGYINELSIPRDDYKGIMEYIDEVPNEARWIPVSERLPKPGEYIGDVDKYYLVQNEYGDMLVARYTHSEYWEQIYQFQPIGDEIVAWRELPQPYNAESEDAE